MVSDAARESFLLAKKSASQFLLPDIFLSVVVVIVRVVHVSQAYIKKALWRNKEYIHGPLE